MKIIPFYLPQFHAIPENDKFWGKDFTEWVNVKNAEPLFEGHKQPVEPLNDNYYNLLDINVMKRQADIARKYGVYGFCFYHYWIEGRKLLEKPVENFLENKDVNIKFCLSWANHTWTDSWAGKNRTLIAQTYGGKEDWEAHFKYLLPYFKDERYILDDGKPLFVIYMPEDIPNLNEMLEYWQKRAVESGLKGLKYAYQYIYFDMNKNKDDSHFDYGIEFQPSYAIADSRGKFMANVRKWGFRFFTFLQNKLHIKIDMDKAVHLEVMDYANIWKYVLSRKPDSNKKIPGAFSGWDNTPRKKERGIVLNNASPQIFKENLSKQIKRAREVYKKDMLFFTAWNEWAEGCILEPTKQDGYAYLEAVRSALEENGELEND